MSSGTKNGKGNGGQGNGGQGDGGQGNGGQGNGGQGGRIYSLKGGRGRFVLFDPKVAHHTIATLQATLERSRPTRGQFSDKQIESAERILQRTYVTNEVYQTEAIATALKTYDSLTRRYTMSKGRFAKKGKNGNPPLIILKSVEVHGYVHKALRGLSHEGEVHKIEDIYNYLDNDLECYIPRNWVNAIFAEEKYKCPSRSCPSTTRIPVPAWLNGRKGTPSSNRKRRDPNLSCPSTPVNKKVALEHLTDNVKSADARVKDIAMHTAKDVQDFASDHLGLIRNLFFENFTRLTGGTDTGPPLSSPDLEVALKYLTDYVKSAEATVKDIAKDCHNATLELASANPGANLGFASANANLGGNLGFASANANLETDRNLFSEDLGKLSGGNGGSTDSFHARDEVSHGDADSLTEEEQMAERNDDNGEHVPDVPVKSRGNDDSLRQVHRLGDESAGTSLRGAVAPAPETFRFIV